MIAAESTVQSGGWWARNWKWFLPVGCLGIIALFAALFVGLFAIVLGSVKSSWAYRNGVQLARDNPDVVEALGTPVETGIWATGSIHVSGPSGTAELAIPLRGPNARATLYVIAEKRAGEWHFDVAEVELRGRKDRIDLLPGRFRGFGAHSRLHTAKILRLSSDLPIVVEIVDTEEKIESFLPLIDEAVGEGLATVEKVEIRFYRASTR